MERAWVTAAGGSSAAMAAAYGVVCGVLFFWFGDPRYVLLAAAGLAAAILVSAGHMLRVIGNYLSAVSYWRRNRHLYGSHPVREARILAGRPRTGVLVLPYMYADYVCYGSGQPVAWGGHCGDLRKLEWLAPVATRPFAEILADLKIGHVLLDLRFAGPDELQLSGTPAAFWASGGFALYECAPGPPARWARSAGGVGAAKGCSAVRGISADRWTPAQHRW